MSQQCRSGLYFDATRQACISSPQGCLQCPVGRMINVPLIKTCDKYISCYYGQSLLRKCENNQQFNVKTGKCDIAKNVDCVDNLCSIYATDRDLVYAPSAASCENYYICLAGKAKLLTCPDGLYFNTECNCCNSSENVKCLAQEFQTPTENIKQKRYNTDYSKLKNTPTLVGETNNVKCPPKGHFLYQYIEDPEYYITCVNGKASLYACTNDFQFDDKLKRCVSKEKKQELNITSFEVNNTEHSGIYAVNNCPEFGAQLIPYEADNHKYFMCVNGKATLLNCPAEHIFDATDNVCRINLNEKGKKELLRYGAVLDEFSGIVCPKFATFTFPHVEKQKFYLCLDGKTSVFRCAEGQFFDNLRNECRKEVSIEELDTNFNFIRDELEFSDTQASAGYEFSATQDNVKCPVGGKTTLPHAQRNQYYSCIDGKAAVFACSPGLFYDAILKSCTKNVPSAIDIEIFKPTLDTDTSRIMCPRFGTFKYPHLDKTKFFLCIDGKTYILTCSQNEIFDADNNICRQNISVEYEDDNNLVAQSSTTLATEIASNVVCPKFGTFMFPHALKSHYYVCIDGNAIGFTCTEGFDFDIKTNSCQRDLNFLENNENQTPLVLDEPVHILCPLRGAMKFAHKEKNKFYLCVNGMGSVLACAEGSFFESETGFCRRTFEIKNTIKEKAADGAETDNESSVKCPISGTFLYPHIEKTQYSVCLEGKSIVLSCLQGLIYDDNKKFCRVPNLSENIGNPTPIVPDKIVSIMCPASGVHKFSHVEKDKFYLCINGMGSIFACPKDSIFESETGTCRRKLTSSEPKENMVESEMEITIDNEMKTSKINCPELGTFIYPHEDTHRFFVCLDGTGFDFSCAESLIFNSTVNYCIKNSSEANDTKCPKQGSLKLPHEDPKKFFLCIDGTATIYNCDNGDFFDVETETCREIRVIGEDDYQFNQNSFDAVTKGADHFEVNPE